MATRTRHDREKGLEHQVALRMNRLAGLNPVRFATVVIRDDQTRDEITVAGEEIMGRGRRTRAPRLRLSLPMNRTEPPLPAGAELVMVNAEDIPRSADESVVFQHILGHPLPLLLTVALPVEEIAPEVRPREELLEWAPRRVRRAASKNAQLRMAAYDMMSGAGEEYEGDWEPSAARSSHRPRKKASSAKSKDREEPVVIDLMDSEEESGEGEEEEEEEGGGDLRGVSPQVALSSAPTAAPEGEGEEEEEEGGGRGGLRASRRTGEDPELLGSSAPLHSGPSGAELVEMAPTAAWFPRPSQRRVSPRAGWLAWKDRNQKGKPGKLTVKYHLWSGGGAGGDHSVSLARREAQHGVHDEEHDVGAAASRAEQLRHLVELLQWTEKDLSLTPEEHVGALHVPLQRHLFWADLNPADLVDASTEPVWATAQGRFRISAHELWRLQPEQYLNDTLVDYALMQFHQGLPDRLRAFTHIHNSFFFHLQQRRYTQSAKLPPAVLGSIAEDEGTSRGQRKKDRDDPFRRMYVFVPICDKDHWSLAIICNAGQLLPSMQTVLNEAEPLLADDYSEEAKEEIRQLQARVDQIRDEMAGDEVFTSQPEAQEEEGGEGEEEEEGPPPAPPSVGAEEEEEDGGEEEAWVDEDDGPEEEPDLEEELALAQKKRKRPTPKKKKKKKKTTRKKKQPVAKKNTKKAAATPAATEAGKKKAGKGTGKGKAGTRKPGGRARDMDDGLRQAFASEGEEEEEGEVAMEDEGAGAGRVSERRKSRRNGHLEETTRNKKRARQDEPAAGRASKRARGASRAPARVVEEEGEEDELDEEAREQLRLMADMEADDEAVEREGKSDGNWDSESESAEASESDEAMEATPPRRANGRTPASRESRTSARLTVAQRLAKEWGCSISLEQALGPWHRALYSLHAALTRSSQFLSYPLELLPDLESAIESVYPEEGREEWGRLLDASRLSAIAAKPLDASILLALLLESTAATPEHFAERRVWVSQMRQDITAAGNATIAAFEAFNSRAEAALEEVVSRLPAPPPKRADDEATPPEMAERVRRVTLAAWRRVAVARGERMGELGALWKKYLTTQDEATKKRYEVAKWLRDWSAELRRALKKVAAEHLEPAKTALEQARVQLERAIVDFKDSELYAILNVAVRASVQDHAPMTRRRRRAAAAESTSVWKQEADRSVTLRKAAEALLRVANSSLSAMHRAIELFHNSEVMGDWHNTALLAVQQLRPLADGIGRELGDLDARIATESTRATRKPQPCIVLLDSNLQAEHGRSATALRKYLKEQYLVRYAPRIFREAAARQASLPGPPRNMPWDTWFAHGRIPGIQAHALPRQHNATDCGLYVLENARSWLWTSLCPCTTGKDKRRRLRDVLGMGWVWFPAYHPRIRREELGDALHRILRDGDQSEESV